MEPEGLLESIEVGKEGIGSLSQLRSAKCEVAKSRRGRRSSEALKRKSKQRTERRAEEDEEAVKRKAEKKIGIELLIQ